MVRDSSRRTFLRGTAALATAASASSSGCLYFLGIREQQKKKTSGKISFASQRDRIKKKAASHIAHNRSQLIDAVRKPEATVWIPEKTTIDMTGEPMVNIANNVTIASNRGLGNGKGGMIKTDDQSNFSVFITEGKTHFRMTGIRFKGPRMDYFDPSASGRDYYDYAVTGVRAYGKSLVVDHCEVMGWTNAGFVPGTKAQATQGWFHHNSMHHNQMAHLGYPIDLYNGMHLIEWNYFDHNRHSIAGFGYPTNGYEARFNVVGPNADHPHFFSFDMHSLDENLDIGPQRNSKVAGKYINVHHNVFEQGRHAALSISGIPEMYARFAYNWVVEKQGAIHHKPNAEMRTEGNTYGTDVIKQGRLWLTNLAEQISQSGGAMATKPSPTGLSLNLSLDKLPNSTAPTNGSQPSTPMNSTSSSANSESRIDPITNIPLTPTNGDY